MELAFTLLANVADPVLAEKLVEPFTALGNGMSSWPVDLPGTAFNRAVKAGKFLRREVMKVVKGRRKELAMTTRREERGGG